MGRFQDASLTIRCTTEQANRVRQAALKEGTSLADFVIKAALDREKANDAAARERLNQIV